MKNIAIFASGSGSNAENIANYFINNNLINIKLFLTNNANAYIIERGKKLNIPVTVFNREQFYKTNEILTLLKNENIDFIVLAGFLWLIPDYLIHAFNGSIINIHPALLPAYGGKGMYGMKVHEAVIQNKEKFSGITIHFVDEHYDEGKIIFQEKCTIDEKDTPETLAQKIHNLEYKYFPEIIEKLLK